MTDSRPVTGTATDVYITRAFAAPRDVVFRFWLEPEQIATWFGPVGYSVPPDTVTIEPRVGGRWNLTMVDDATGQRSPITGTFEEFVDSELLVMNLSAQTEAGPLENITLRVQFHDHGERTRITLHQGPFSLQNRDDTTVGWEMSFVKLDGVLAAPKG